MRHLNYNHLLYFWMVAKEGSIAKASEILYITPQTISGQLKLLEQSVDEALFKRAGRGLALTNEGESIYLYADEIFNLGAELSERVHRKMISGSNELRIGIVNSIPKLIAYKTLQPALTLEDPLRIICDEGELDTLLGNLAVHQLDLIISDRMIPNGLNVKAFNHILGESNIAFYASNKIARKYIKNFPQSLNNAPMLLPKKDNDMRKQLETWFDKIEVIPNIIAEFDDNALLKTFGQAGAGIFPAPLAISEHVEQMCSSKQLGAADSVKETYYAISPERKLKHPGVIRITSEARDNLLD